MKSDADNSPIYITIKQKGRNVVTLSILSEDCKLSKDRRNQPPATTVVFMSADRTTGAASFGSCLPRRTVSMADRRSKL
jgi:hypothetical protein